MQIRIVYVGQSEEPVVRTVEDDLKTFNSLVGGYLEMVRLEARPGPGLCVWVNEEGALIPLPPNRCGFRGPFFVSRFDTEGESVSLSDHDVRIVLAHLDLYKALPPTPVGGGSIRIVGGDTIEEVFEKQAEMIKDDLRRN